MKEHGDHAGFDHLHLFGLGIARLARYDVLLPQPLEHVARGAIPDRAFIVAKAADA